LKLQRAALSFPGWLKIGQAFRVDYIYLDRDEALAPVIFWITFEMNAANASPLPDCGGWDEILKLGTITLIFQVAHSLLFMIFTHLPGYLLYSQVQTPPSVLLQAAAPQTTSPSASEVLVELNKARTNPIAYADWLETLRPYYADTILSLPGEDRIRTQTGTAALDSAIAFLRQRQPLPALTLSVGMSQGAQDHVNDIGSVGAIGNIGSDNSHVGDRVNRYGTWGNSITELTSYGKRTAAATVALLILNDRLRTEIFNPEFQALGIACGTHANQGSMCVLDYAGKYTEQGAVQPGSSEPIAPAVEAAVEASEPSTPAANDSPSAELTFPSVMVAIASTEYFTDLQNVDYLSPIELAVIAETNRLRHDPKTYADELEHLKQYYDGQYLKLPGFPRIETVEGVAAVDEAIAALRNRDRLPQLTPSRGMSLGARDHVKDMGDRGTTGHYGSDGSDPFVRISRYGNWEVMPGKSVAGENISFSPLNIAHWHILQWLIDDGVANRGHREALLRPEYRRTGVACGRHRVYENMCVMEYASDYVER
jgi:uncharacterized protein YkwD